MADPSTRQGGTTMTEQHTAVVDLETAEHELTTVYVAACTCGWTADTSHRDEADAQAASYAHVTGALSTPPAPAPPAGVPASYDVGAMARWVVNVQQQVIEDRLPRVTLTTTLAAWTFLTGLDDAEALALAHTLAARPAYPSLTAVLPPF